MLLTAGVVYAASSPASYDTDDSGFIGSDEAGEALDDYFAGDLNQQQALEVLLHHWHQQPVAQPRQADPVAAPPERAPSLYCENGHKNAVGPGYNSKLVKGEWVGYRVVNQAAKHVRVTFTNPDTTKHYWAYGFNIYESGARINIWLDSSGEWRIVEGHGKHGKLVDLGSFRTHGVHFDVTGKGTNELIFRTLTPDAGYALFVNGMKVPLNLSRANLPTEYEWLSEDREYRINADQIVWYERLCTSLP